MAKELGAADVFRRITTARKLKSLYEDHVYQGLSRGRDGMRSDALLSNIGSVAIFVSKRMRDGNYRFTTYRELLKSKGSNKAPRVISIPTARDRMVLKTLAHLLMTVYPEGKGRRSQPIIERLKIALLSGRYDTYIRFDIQDFYPNIVHGILQQKLSRRIRKKQILDLISAAITTNTLGDNARRSRRKMPLGVPQGLPISNVLAEIYLGDFDREMAGVGGIAYFRYVDDILILCTSSDSTALVSKVQKSLEGIGLKVHDMKDANSKSRSGPISDPIEYLGYLFAGSTISVRQSSMDNIESSLVKIFINYKKSLREHPSNTAWQAARVQECLWRLNLRITGCIYESKPRGWLNYFSQLNDLKLLKARDASVKRLIKRFGLPPSFQPKTFTRAYWHISKPNNTSAKYIPTLDKASIDEMRWVLEVVFRYPKKVLKRDKDVLLKYKFESAKLVSDLEQDIRMVS